MESKRKRDEGLLARNQGPDLRDKMIVDCVALNMLKGDCDAIKLATKQMLAKHIGKLHLNSTITLS